MSLDQEHGIGSNGRSNNGTPPPPISDGGKFQDAAAQLREAGRNLSFDAIIVRIGPMGIYQFIRIFLILYVFSTTVASHGLVNIFFASYPEFHCYVEEFESEPYMSYNDSVRYSLAYPINSISVMDNTQIVSSCSMYSPLLDINDTDTSEWDTEPCVNGYTYSTPGKGLYRYSVAMQWDIVCDDLWLGKLSQSLFMVGLMIGVLLCGTISDSFGRKPMLFILLGVQIVVSAVTAAMPNFYSFIICRLLIGTTTASVYLMMFTLAMELVSSEWRTSVGMACEAYFGIGIMLLAGIAYLVQEWRYLQLVISFLPFPLLFTWWIIPESPRWLMTKGRYNEAWVIIKKIASTNKRQIPDDIEEAFLEAMKAEDKHFPLADANEDTFSKTYTTLDLFRHKTLIIRTCILVFNWIVNSMVYYGLSLNSADLGGNIYINTTIAGAVEIPATVIAIFFLAKVGRKYTLAFLMIGAGVACISTVFFSSESTAWVAVTMAMLGKFAITATFAIIYVYSAELYPTVIRNIGVGFCSFMARIGSIVSPFIALLGSTVWVPLPFIIFGAFAITAGLLVFFLDETVNKPLPDTIEDIKKMKRALNPEPEDVDKIEVIMNPHTKAAPMLSTETSM